MVITVKSVVAISRQIMTGTTAAIAVKILSVVESAIIDTEKTRGRMNIGHVEKSRRNLVGLGLI